MFRSILRLGPKFIKTKNYVYEDKTGIKKDLAKTYVVFLGTLITGGAVIINFAVPTPDIQFDIKCITSPEFYQYAHSKGKFFHSTDLTNTLKAYYINHGKIMEGIHKDDYRRSFIDRE